MNVKQAEKKLIELFDRKPDIDQPGRLIPHLVNELGVSGRQRESIIVALDRLAESGAVELEKVGKVYNRVRRVRHSSERYHERGAELRRQRNHATDATGAQLPSHLPDSMCTPVVVRVDESAIKLKHQPEIIPTQRQSAESEPKVEETDSTEVSDEAAPSVYKTGDLFHETLTECLHALRVMANPDGVSEEGVGVRQVLLAHGLTDSQAGNVMDYLRGMSLYTASMTGFQKSTYVVKLEPAEVTPEMVRAQRAAFNAKARQDDVAEAEVAPTVLDENNPLDKLAAIIVNLEAELADQKQKLEKANERLKKAAKTHSSDLEKLARRDAKLKKVEAQNEELKSELNKVRSSPVLQSSPLAAQILDRYR